MSQEALVCQAPPPKNIENTKVHCKLFHSGLYSSYRRQYSGSMLMRSGSNLERNC